MMKVMHVPKMLITAWLLVVLFAACAKAPAPLQPLVSTVTITPKLENLEVGKSVALSAEVAGENNPDTVVDWSSSDENVAIVSSSGSVTGIKVGSAKVVATSRADKTKSDTINLIIFNTTPTVTEVVILEGSYLELGVYEVASLTAQISGENDPLQTVTWLSSDPNIVAVSGSGNTALVTANWEGVAIITATSTADSTKSASMTVSVSHIPPRPCTMTYDEPNNYPDEATSITVPLYFYAASLCEGDVDVYFFTLNSYSYVTIDVTGDYTNPNPLNTMLVLGNSNLVQIAFSDDVFGLDPQIATYLAPGTYYIGVTGYGDDFFGGYHFEAGAYSLSINTF